MVPWPFKMFTSTSPRELTKMSAITTQRSTQAAVAAGVHVHGAASVYGKPTMNASWSITPFLGIDADHKPEPRRLRVPSP